MRQVLFHSRSTKLTLISLFDSLNTLLQQGDTFFDGLLRFLVLIAHAKESLASLSLSSTCCSFLNCDLLSPDLIYGSLFSNLNYLALVDKTASCSSHEFRLRSKILGSLSDQTSADKSEKVHEMASLIASGLNSWVAARICRNGRSRIIFLSLKHTHSRKLNQCW